MEQDVENYRPVCTTCLSSDRNLFPLSGMGSEYQIFRLLIHDFAVDQNGDIVEEMEQLICWECLALMRKFIRFRQQVHRAQEHRVLFLSRAQETMDHTYVAQSLSSLKMCSKNDYDKMYLDYTAKATPWQQQYIAISSADVKSEYAEQTRANNDGHMLKVPQMVLENRVTGVRSHIVVGTDATVSHADTFTQVKGELAEATAGDTATPSFESILVEGNASQQKKPDKVNSGAYITEYLAEDDMLAFREAAKLSEQFASSSYKCELCIVGFRTQQEVEDHYNTDHIAKPGQVSCKVCYCFIDEIKLSSHLRSHYYRYTCKVCGYVEFNQKLISLHIKTHMPKSLASGSIKTEDGGPTVIKKGRKKKQEEPISTPPPNPEDLRKLLSKTTIEGYQCLKCDMFFKNAAARKNHVAKLHRDGQQWQCDHCKKVLVNRNTLVTHLKLHEGPLPRKECPICYKMVRVVQLKYHIERHENKTRYECSDCNKMFSHLSSYQAHFKKARAHAVFPFSCSICKKGYPTKERMQDHFNYQHLGKTAHKCPICDKQIASQKSIEIHMRRVHVEKTEKPRIHQCQQCGKAFADKKTLVQHGLVHSDERPLSCEICQQTFKQSAALYLHRKRVHKQFSARGNVNSIDNKFPCTVCKKGFPTKERMQDHFNYQHLGITAHKCPICDKPIASRKCVKDHMTRVHGEKKEKHRNHCCAQCGKAFADKKALTQHEVVHSNERPLSCGICEHTFKQKSALYTHRKRVHNVFPSKKNVNFMETTSGDTSTRAVN